MSTLRIAGATLNQTPLAWENNLINIRAAVDDAISSDVDILCLPELCITGYGCEDMFLSDWIYTKAMECLLEATSYCKNITVAIGLPVKHRGLFYNTTCLIQDEQILGFYIKQNMANDGVHYEPRWFTPWRPGIIDEITIEGKSFRFGDLTFELSGIKIGFEICEDAWREERPACRLFEQKVNLILNPSASHFAFEKTRLREKLVIDSSKNFHCTYVYANLLGNEAGRMIYDGEILIARHGKLIKRNEWLSYKSMQLQFADVDFNKEEETYPKPDEWPRDKNTEFVKASSLALFDYLRKSHSKGFVLSLSGGADSSSIAVLVSEMVRRGVEELGAEKFIKKTGISTLQIANGKDQQAIIKHLTSQILTCAYQGTVNSSEATFQSAKELAESIGATFHSWLIDEEVNSYTQKIEKALKRPLTWEADDIALQNIQARSRSPIIWMLANIESALLLTTSNRSEADVGYATMDGDTSGSIAPIAAVDKHFIITWLRWAERNLGYEALNYVNNLQPSAELRPLSQEQTDEADLMPYPVIVEIEKLAIRDRKSPTEVFHALNAVKLESSKLLKVHIAKFFRLWSRNQWKRERTAPAFHLDDFNVDPRTWCRFPILSSGFSAELKELEGLG
ncbi:NAD(+) synthase [Fulvivirga sp. 29W222]|uniref:Glutamine-dependent NAD(+) synthetase n=1 Tax=Fulvivirga marina TaxID=2494733 RepID=A0A937FTA6_9BACT|nr:NAD(+) synthase [Fulvivirga marina]MBL6445244.1 NAD(+) synthase [Fulvivirga marina]